MALPGRVIAAVADGAGVSSKTIAHVLGGLPVDYTSHPLDVDDFGRCYRLLLLFPEWRPRLGEVAERYPHWRPLVAAWNEITASYESEKKTTARLYETNELIRKVRP
jgi:hypothetical protein